MNRLRLLLLCLCAGLISTTITYAEVAGGADGREKAKKLHAEGNYNEAYDLYSALSLDAKTDEKLVAGDYRQAYSSLHQLGRINEVDAFREKVVKVHATNWRLLWEVASTYMNGTHYGYMISGEFYRGNHRGGGSRRNAMERDRTRAIQLMQQGM
ncbi:MAG TPA: hypothetical protein ENL03_05160, partial [Phycisphaerae bacterium]|nr:hypothetical protein [Phycisphaerae bacterium]